LTKRVSSTGLTRELLQGISRVPCAASQGLVGGGCHGGTLWWGDSSLWLWS